MDIEIPISGIVKEACRLVDSSDDSDVIGATASVLHNVLVAGEPSASNNASDYNFKVQEGAWKQLLLYLHELDDARRRQDASTVTDSVRASFFWQYFEPWAAMLLPAASCQLPKSQQQHRQQRTGPGARLPLLLAALMQLAPAPVLLQSLVSHLSLVTPLDASSSEIGPRKMKTGPLLGRMSSGASARVTSRGAELAAAFLAQRFATNMGVPELLLHLAVDAALIRESSTQLNPREGNVSAQRSWHNQSPHQRQQQQLEEGGVRSQIHADPDPDPDPNRKPPEDRTQACGSGIVMSQADEAVLRHLLLLPPAVASHQHSSRPSSSKAAAASMYGLHDPALLATLLVSVPDRVAGLLAAGPAVTTLPGSPDCLSLLQPEAFYWLLLQQLLAAIGDPAHNVVAAMQRLRCNLDEGTAPLTLVEAGVAHCSCVASTETASGGGTDDNSADANGDADSGGDGGSGGDAGISAAGVTSLEPFVMSAAVELMAEVLARLAKRGHAATAADALLACTTGLGPAYETDERHYGGRGSGGRQRLQEGCSAALLHLADADSAALERLLAALLDRGAAAGLALTAAWASASKGPDADEVAPATGGRENEGRGQEEPAASWQSALHLQQLTQLHQREVVLGFSPPLSSAALAAALSALSWLVPPHVAAHPVVSYILTDRMLLSLQRQPLPLDSLQLLLALLPAAYPGAQPTAAATMLAAAWGDVAAVTRTSVQRQAYLTQALLLVLARLDRATVEGTPGLLGGLLGGVSQRLGSPLLVTQRQAMRVGRAFSLVLDPASDLFADMGDLGLALEELRPGALPREVQWRPASGPRTGSQLPRPPAFTSAVVGGAGGTKEAADAAETILADTHASVDEGAGRDARNEPSRGADGAVEDGEGRGDSGSVCTATDSDDEDTVEGGDDADEDEELRPLGSVEEMEGDPEAEAWRRAEPSSLQLRALAAALRKQDDVKGVLAALKCLEEIIRAAPDELGLMAPELVRSLLHCRVPEWAEEGSEGREGSSGRGPGASTWGAAPSSALDQRRNCLVALLAVAPFPAGDALLPEVYSPHLDLHQRLTLLDSLTAAAAELADPRVAPRLTQGPGGRPVLQRPDLSQLPAAQRRRQLSSGTQTPAASSRSGKGDERAPGGCEANDGVQGGGNAILSQPGVLRRGPRTRVWAPAALRKRKEQEAAAAAGAPAGGPVAFRNRFADVALRWAAGLLREVDRVKHGVDLLGRDHQLLGRLLTTLAAFAEAAAGSAALPPLASATLELIRAPQVHGHPEPYVRRAALLSVGQVLAQLPPAAVAGALLGTGIGGPGGTGGLAERLEWVSVWCRALADGDVDPYCRTMAQACVNLQADLASRCLVSIQDAASAAAPLAPTLPTLDLARTARLLAESPTPSLTGDGHGGWGGLGSAAAALVRDVSAW